MHRVAGLMQARRAELVYQTSADKPLFNLKVVAEPSHG
jgi:hypothetical protein